MNTMQSFVELLRGAEGGAVGLAQRIVKTEAGAKYFGEPIGSLVTVNSRKKNPTGVPGVNVPSPTPGNKPAPLTKDTRSALAQSLREIGAEPSKTAKAIALVSDEGQAKIFLDHLRKMAEVKPAPAQDAVETKKVDVKDLPSVEAKVTEKNAAAKDYRIIRWKDQEIKVPDGARIGQTSAIGKYPAVFYWYDQDSGTVHGVQDDGKPIPAIELPAGQSIQKFMSDLKKSGGPLLPFKNAPLKKINFAKKV